MPTTPAEVIWEIVMQFMEDMFGTAPIFRSGGVASYQSDPDGGEVML